MSVWPHRVLVWVAAGIFLAGCSPTSYKAPIIERKHVRKARVVSVPAVAGQYVIQPGDTLYKIAFENGLDYRELAAWNGIAEPYTIYVGASLQLKPPKNAAIAVQAAGASGAASPALPAQDPELPPDSWVWPVKGRIITTFSEADGRKGIDISAPQGTPVLASAAGRVVYVGNGLRGYGKLIIIKHSRTLLSAYAHQSRMLVREGEQVARGQKIGEVGDTDAEQAKLHFEIRENGKPVSPTNYLPS